MKNSNIAYFRENLISVQLFVYKHSFKVASSFSLSESLEVVKVLMLHCVPVRTSKKLHMVASGL